jgi:hypothetical protein
MNASQRLGSNDRLRRVVVPGEFSALLVQPALQLSDQGVTTLLAHAQTLLLRKTVDSRSMANRISIRFTASAASVPY